MKPTPARTQDREGEAGQSEAVYAELEPLSGHRAFVDHLYILKDDGRLTGLHRSVFASPLCEIALVCSEDAGSLHRGDEAERWIAVRELPRFGQRSRQRAFRGWMIGIRCRPSSVVFESETALAALAGVFAGVAREQNLLDGIIHALDGWIEDIVGKSGFQEAEFAGSLDVAAAFEQSAAMPATDGNPTIAARAAAAGVSPRTMLRHVRARTGLAPKRYASLQRFSQALRHLARHAGLSPGRFRALARRQIRTEAVRFFKDGDLLKRVRLLVCDSGAPIGAAADTGKGQYGQ